VGIADFSQDGIHPNTIVLAVPLLASLNMEPTCLVTFIVALGVANAFGEFIPSMLLSAVDSESGLATLPGQRMLAQGNGLTAIRLAVTGGIVAVGICALAIPLLALSIPAIYATTRPIIWVVLAAFVGTMVLTERLPHKIFWAMVCVLASGAIGLLAFSLPIDRATILFPVFTGFFAFPHMILQIRDGVQIPKQSYKESDSGIKQAIRPAALGAAGGALAGLLPGIGSAEIASVLTVEKNDRTFLTTMGALSVSNIVMSFLALWLIGNPRSGVAVAVDQLISIDFGMFLTIIFAVLVATAIAAPLTIVSARRLLNVLQRINYVRLSQLIFLALAVGVGLFTGPLGVLLALTCAGLGLFVNVVQIKRGLLMGVLIIPTMLFLMGV